MSKQKRFFILLMSISILVAGAFIISFLKEEKPAAERQMTAPRAHGEEEILYYTCGMHPSVRVSPEDYEKGNNKCPICGMGLVPVYPEQEGMQKMSGEHEGFEKPEVLVKLSPRAQALAEVRTEEVTFRELFKEIRSVGQIDYDERRVAYVAAWIPGRIDKLFVDFTGLNVKKKDPLAWIYSPDLVTAQEEYILARETLRKVIGSADKDTISGAESLVKASRKRLLLWGISDKQIKEIEQRKEADTHMTIYAPIGGTVIRKNVWEGEYVKQGENLYQIADLSDVWVMADIYESEISWIKQGHPVEIFATAYPGEKFKGHVSFINPYLNPQTRSVKVRINVPNPQLKLKPGMFVDVFIRSQIHEEIQPVTKTVYTCSMHPEVMVENPGDCPICGMPLVKKIQGSAGTSLAVPKDAVIDTGVRKLVYIEKEKGVYVPREVELGLEAEGIVNGKKKTFYVLKKGLLEGMRVVSHANFLIDSQSRITGQAETVYSGAIEAEGEEKQVHLKR